jgi:hypothetical protein
MKRQLFFALLLTPLFVLKAFGQGADNTENSFSASEDLPKTELRINALALLVGPALDVSYEHVLSNSSGLGGSLLLNFGGDNYGNQKFALTPFYRFYFFNQKDYGARGLFVEGFSSLASVEPYLEWLAYDDDLEPIPQEKQGNDFQWSVGFAAGRKWINQKGFSFEIFLGVGRYLLSTETTDEVHPRIGASFGKRF